MVFWEAQGVQRVTMVSVESSSVHRSTFSVNLTSLYAIVQLINSKQIVREREELPNHLYYYFVFFLVIDR